MLLLAMYTSALLQARFPYVKKIVIYENLA